jgi:hypothetical protein
VTGIPFEFQVISQRILYFSLSSTFGLFLCSIVAGWPFNARNDPNVDDREKYNWIAVGPRGIADNLKAEEIDFVGGGPVKNGGVTIVGCQEPRPRSRFAFRKDAVDNPSEKLIGPTILDRNTSKKFYTE